MVEHHLLKLVETMKKTINLQHQLELVRDRVSPLQEVNTILANDSIQDRELLTKIAPKSKLSLVVEEDKNNDKFKQMRERHGNVFTIDMIREIALRFDLKFLPSVRFQGELPMAAIQSIKNNRMSHLPADKFFIMAPANMFTKEPRNIDPILFCEVTHHSDSGKYYVEQEKFYIFVHKWGNDISARRELWTKLKYNRLVRFIVIGLGISALFQFVMSLMPIPAGGRYMLGFVLFMPLLAISLITGRNPFKYEQ